MPISWKDFWLTGWSQQDTPAGTLIVQTRPGPFTGVLGTAYSQPGRMLLGSLLVASNADNRIGSDSPVGQITETGAVVDARSAQDSVAGSLNLTGLTADARRTADVVTGTVQLTGLSVESRTTVNVDVGTEQLTGADVQVVIHQDTAVGTVNLAGTVVETHAEGDIEPGTITVTGTVVESHTAVTKHEEGGASPFVIWPTEPAHASAELQLVVELRVQAVVTGDSEEEELLALLG